MWGLLCITPCIFQLNHWVLDRLLPNRNIEAITRLNGLALQVCICASFFVHKDLNDILRIFYIFVGHMIYDLFYVDTPAMKAHHLLCISIPIIYHTYLKYIFETTYTDVYYVYKGLVLLESTSPLLNCVWLFHHFQYPNTILHACIKAAAALYWTVMRMIVFPYMVFTDGTFYSHIFMYPFIPLNLIWFYALLKRVRKEFRAQLIHTLPAADS